MRFYISPDIRRNRLLRHIIVWSLFFIFLFWCTNWFFYLRIGLSPRKMVTYYHGSEAEFRPPKSFFSLLEETHFHAFAMMILIMTMTHLLLFSQSNGRVKWFLIHGTFGAALGDMASGWLIRYLHPGFVYLKILSFLLLQACLFIMMFMLIQTLRKGVTGREEIYNGYERRGQRV